MEISVNTKTFQGPRDRHYGIPSIFIIYFLLSLLIFFMFDMWNNSQKIFHIFLVVEIILLGMTGGIWCLYYTVGKKAGFFDKSSYILMIRGDKIESIITESGKRHVRVVFTDNIKKMQYVRDFGGTGHKIKIWPKDYEILAKSGFEFGEGVLGYYKKHNTPVILFPPALSREERKRLKEAIEEFKKRNGIE